MAQDLEAQAAPAVDLADQDLVVHLLAEGSFSSLFAKSNFLNPIHIKMSTFAAPNLL